MKKNNSSSKIRKKNFSLLTIAILATTIAVLSAALVLASTVQQANAQSTSFSFTQNQRNACSGFTGCGNSGTITFNFGDGGPGRD